MILFGAFRKIASVLAVMILFIAGVSRFADGPLVDFLPGGHLIAGEWVEKEPHGWRFVAAEATVELESDGRSRKTWILERNGVAYIPASLVFPPFKTWHKRALEDPEAVVRVFGQRYPRRLYKIDDPALEARLRDQLRRKYGDFPIGGTGIWFFRLDPPS